MFLDLGYEYIQSQNEHAVGHLDYNALGRCLLKIINPVRNRGIFFSSYWLLYIKLIFNQMMSRPLLPIWRTQLLSTSLILSPRRCLSYLQSMISSLLFFSLRNNLLHLTILIAGEHNGRGVPQKHSGGDPRHQQWRTRTEPRVCIQQGKRWA